MRTHFLKSAVNILNGILGTLIAEGQTLVDATVGNGRDTATLSRLAGKQGHVYGFDIQKEALERASDYLSEQGCRENVTLIHDSHAEIDHYISVPLDFVLFNLGYLPGGDKNITTYKKSSLIAMEKGIEMLHKGGFLAAVLYSGHEAGAVETQAIIQWAQQLDQKVCDVLSVSFINQVNDPPQLILIEKRG